MCSLKIEILIGIINIFFICNTAGTDYIAGHDSESAIMDFTFNRFRNTWKEQTVNILNSSFPRLTLKTASFTLYPRIVMISLWTRTEFLMWSRKHIFHRSAPMKVPSYIAIYFCNLWFIKGKIKIWNVNTQNNIKKLNSLS